MARIDLEELKGVIRSHPNYESWRLGEDTNIYVRIGPGTGRSGFRSETRMGADGREVIFDIDQQGLLRGIEFQ
jgi:hypothetical protein